MIRWPFTLTSANNVVRFSSIGGAGDSDQTIPAGAYINKGETGTGLPNDFIDAFETAATAAATALGLTGSYRVSLVTDVTSNTDGRVYIIRVGGADPADSLAINFLAGATTLNPLILGWDGTFNPTFDSLGETSTYQAWDQWAPNVFPKFDSGGQARAINFESRNLNGRPIRISHNDSPWTERLIDWSTPGIAAARMLDARVAEAAFATVGAIAVDDPNTWENFWRYLNTAGDDNPVYIYSSNDPASATQSGAYEVILDDSEPGMEGVGLGDYVANRSSEHYPVRISLWSAS